MSCEISFSTNDPNAWCDVKIQKRQWLAELVKLKNGYFVNVAGKKFTTQICTEANGHTQPITVAQSGVALPNDAGAVFEGKRILPGYTAYQTLQNNNYVLFIRGT